METEQTFSPVCRLVLEWRTRCNFLCLIGLIETDSVRKLIFQVAIHFSISQSTNIYWAPPMSFPLEREENKHKWWPCFYHLQFTWRNKANIHCVIERTLNLVSDLWSCHSLLSSIICGWMRVSWNRALRATEWGIVINQQWNLRKIPHFLLVFSSVTMRLIVEPNSKSGWGLRVKTWLASHLGHVE